MTIIREYPCPHCETMLEVTDPAAKFNCANCNRLLGVDTDAEFEDGMWRDLTELYIVKP